MSERGFSIDISKLPPAASPDSVVQDTNVHTHGAINENSIARPATTSQQHSATLMNNTTSGSQSAATHSPPHALAGVFGSSASNIPRTGSPLGSPSGRGTVRSGTGTANASPRHLSPATSQIFERDVQEPTPLTTSELGQAVPAHLQTEDHIPAVLDQSVEVITDSRVNPDDVEIVMHKDHVPAAAVAEAAVGGGMSDSGFLNPPHSEMTDPSHSSFPSIAAHLAHKPEDSTTTSSQTPYYGTVDPADPRRLSFISYADIVHAQHPERSDPAHHPLSQVSTPGHRSPSPARTGSPLHASTGKSLTSALLGVGNDFSSLGRRSSVASGTGAGYGRRTSVAHGAGTASPNVEAGLPHGETRGEIVVESLRDAMAHPKE